MRALKPSPLKRWAACLALLMAAGCSTLPAGPDQAALEPAGTLSASPVAGASPAGGAGLPVASVGHNPAASAATPSDEDRKWTGREAPAGHDDLWDRIRAGFAMPDLDTSLVADRQRAYLRHPESLSRMLERGGRYLFHIVEEIEKRGMPTELALLPFVESAMDPTALSHAKAAGLWQFIPSTGKAFNLDQNWWVDNRRDVVKSTTAALDYLEHIYAMHGNDWFLALASYNWGEGAVGRAIKRNQARRQPTDYLSLKMPAETRHYVPKLLALKHIVQHADRHGLRLPELPNRPYFVTLEKTRPVDLKLAARFAGMSVEEFVALNPAHNRPVISASRNNQIKLPADRVDAFVDAVEAHGRSNRAFATWQPYTLKAGDTLEALASRAGITVAELRTANGLQPGSRILAGTRILSPHGQVEDESRVEAFDGPRIYELVQKPALHHVVRQRDTLSAIARRYGTTVAELRRLNGLKTAVAPRGARLLVRQASTQTLLTTENGARRVIANDAVIMRASNRAPTATPAPAAARGATTHSVRPAAGKPAATPSRSSPKVPVARQASGKRT